MSTTGPMTWTTLPTFCAVATAIRFLTGSLSSAPYTCCAIAKSCRGRSRAALQRLRARYDLDDFPRDRRLPHLVHVKRQALDHLSRIARRRIHRRHLRGVESGVRFEQRPEDLHFDVGRDQAREQMFGARLVEILGRRRGAFRRLDVQARDWQQALDHDALHHDGLELVVTQVDAVDVAAEEGV